MKKHTDRNVHPGSYIPRYCPLELYSSNPERVGVGLYALWDDWIQSKGTINTLRIFVDGRVLDPTQVMRNLHRFFMIFAPAISVIPNLSIPSNRCTFVLWITRFLY